MRSTSSALARTISICTATVSRHRRAMTTG
jgi:hypothetical protein